MKQLDEHEICNQLMKWMQEGEKHYDMMPIRPRNKAHPSTVRGYMQMVGWVRRDLRVCLDLAYEKIRELKQCQNTINK